MNDLFHHVFDLTHRMAAHLSSRICDRSAQNQSYVILGFFYSIVFYTASASKYFLQNQNVLFLTEVILVWLEKPWKVKYLNTIQYNI